MEQVVIVDSKDNEIGLMEKLEAHKKGALHRAFSVIILNSNGEMLLQKRADQKYHSGGLWTNACCSHPKAGETTLVASKRRLEEEVGISLDPQYAYKFIYKTTLDNGLIEHEYDHVFIGRFDGSPRVNPDEVSDWKYLSISAIKTDINKNPDDYTAWFKIIMETIQNHLD